MRLVVGWSLNAIFYTDIDIAVYRLLVNAPEGLDQPVFNPATRWLWLRELSLALHIAHLCVDALALLRWSSILIHRSVLLLLNLILLCSKKETSQDLNLTYAASYGIEISI